jgi:uncharacterized membrane protein YfcA
VEITELVISLTSVFTFSFLLGFENFLWGLALPMILGGVFLTPLAAFTAKRISKRWLGISIGALLIILNLRTLLRAYGIMIL